MNQQIVRHLEFLYGEEQANTAAERLEKLMTAYESRMPDPPAAQPERFSQRDVVLITYGDMLKDKSASPLSVLANFLESYLVGLVSTVHLLPFFPFSSDDGFSIIDYREVDPGLGTWSDVARFGHNFRLMFDAVINHVSVRSEWFQRFLNADPVYRKYFIDVAEGTDLSEVFRPRVHPLLTPFDTHDGEKLVWTTFSPDQADLNFANLDVLIDIVDTLLFYIRKGATLIRLDAVAYLWKELGTSSIHLPQTHRVIKLLRDILDEVAPHVLLVTETNVPHEENISYFGNGKDEAQMVYNFSLPPLTLHAFHSENVDILSRWAQSLTLPSKHVTFFNFLASHDGIGLMPVRTLLGESEVKEIVKRIEALGGYVSYKSNPDGSRSPYELNINYLDALGNPELEAEDPEIASRRFLSAQAIMLSLKGVPGIYFHSILGSRSWKEGVIKTGRFRSINRQKLDLSTLEFVLEIEGSLRSKVFGGYCQLLRERISRQAFHPSGRQLVLTTHPAIFTTIRTSPTGENSVLCLHSVSRSIHRVLVDLSQSPLKSVDRLVDIFTGAVFTMNKGSKMHIEIRPYGVLWLVPVK
jgi:sucrose phosphorylase